MRIVTPREAASYIRDEDTVAVCGIVSLVTANDILVALGERFQQEAHPRDLTLVSPNRTGQTAPEPFGFDHLAHEGLVRRLITSTFNAKDSPVWGRMAETGRFAAYSLPMGVMLRWIRECAARSPGLLTTVGLNTYADPDGGCADIEVASGIPAQDIVRSVEIDGERALLYRSLPIKVAIIRGTVIDTNGNISMDDEPVDGGMLHLAMAARNCGGIVLAQVKRVVEAGTIDPRLVRVPGFMVDYAVVSPDSIQTQNPFEPAFTGQSRISPLPLDDFPLNVRKFMARRAWQELRKGDVVNLGVGVGSDVPRVALEEGRLSDYVFSVEHGALGGLPASGGPGKTGAFGAHYNPESIIDAAEVFDFYHGGGLDATVLGFAQVRGDGSVNVGRIAGRPRGPGGFVDISHATPTVLFCGTLTAGDTKIDLFDSSGRPAVHVRQEGRQRKFVNALEQVNFHGPSAVAKGQTIRFITERAVFTLTAAGLVMDEIAPGLTVDEVRGASEFDFGVATGLREFSPELFAMGPMHHGAQFPNLGRKESA